jgi:hypothetical protein
MTERVPSEPGCEASPSTACGVLAESHPSREIIMFACLCGAMDEGYAVPSECWGCGGEMRQWAVRSPRTGKA